MRVIAGWLGGRQFDSPGGHRTHPMSEKARGAIFNALGDIKGLTVLDAFAGSGALSFEAVSRGAKHVVALDIDKGSITSIVKGVKALGLDEQITVRQKNAASWARSNQHGLYDIVLADPPYNDIRPDVLQKLVYVVEPDGLFVLSWPGSEPIRPFEGLEVRSSKNYGDAQLVFYRRTK